MVDPKIKVGVLGCTGMVGQRFIQLLENHPYFQIAAVGASERSAGKKYDDACLHWKMQSDIPEEIKSLMVVECKPEHFSSCRLVFSGLDSSVAGAIEKTFAKEGIAVFSNSKNYRMDPLVPLVIPAVNSDHLSLSKKQAKAYGYKEGGYIVCNPNCASTGIVIALKPIVEKYGIETCFISTMQAISGAGYPGLSGLDMLDNVVPFISGEEEKCETEPLKILGKLKEDGSGIEYADFKTSAHCNRVHVFDGHTACVSLKLKSECKVDDIKSLLAGYSTDEYKALPSHADNIMEVLEQPNRPQPRLDRDRGRGFTISVGRVRPDPIFDVKFTCLSHNTVIGAAGGAIMNAESAKNMGLLK
eukprot:Nk52_evm19s1444 gene=Nk52_evmTU19s1444